VKALVTGGAGFIGSNVVSLLIEKGWEVRVLDNFSSGYLDNLDGLDVALVEGDIRDQETCAKACEGMNVVFHLAASVGRQRSLDFPQADSETNLVGTVNILEGMRKRGVQKIVYSSSAAIFGEPETETVSEDHPQNPDSPYGVSKMAAEKMVIAYRGLYGIEAVCLRYFNIYGRRQRYDLYGNVIPIFARRLLEGQPLPIYGDGQQTRDFLNVRDVAHANYLAATGSQNGAYNLGSGSSITIEQLARWMREISGRAVDIAYEPRRPADVLHCGANSQKAELELGFKASVSLCEGLAEYWQWVSAQ
jgi:nucleoside-diphosphate-sugar epimerase